MCKPMVGMTQIVINVQATAIFSYVVYVITFMVCQHKPIVGFWLIVSKQC